MYGIIKTALLIVLWWLLSGCLGSGNSQQTDLLKMGYSQEEFEIIRKRQEYEKVSHFSLVHKLKPQSQVIALNIIDISTPMAMIIPLPQEALSILYIDKKYSIKDDKILLISHQDYFFDSVQKELIIKLHPSYFYFLEGNRLQIKLNALVQLKKGKTALFKRTLHLQYRPMIKAKIGRYSFKYIDLTTLTIDDIAPYIVQGMQQQAKFVHTDDFNNDAYKSSVRDMLKALYAYTTEESKR